MKKKNSELFNYQGEITMFKIQKDLCLCRRYGSWLKWMIITSISPGKALMQTAALIEHGLIYIYIHTFYISAELKVSKLACMVHTIFRRLFHLAYGTYQ